MAMTAELSQTKQLLLERLLRGDETRGSFNLEQVAPRPREAIPPITPEQEQVWLHAAMAPDLPVYNEAITIHRRGSFDLGVLERSLNEILRRHEIWRTSFRETDGEVAQVVHPTLGVRLPLIDLSRLPRAEAEREALRLATEEARKPLPLSIAPLFHASVIKVAEDDHRLHLTLHHIIFDGVSIYRVIVPELAALYDAFLHGESPDLPAPALQYGDYAHWREARPSDNAVAAQLGYWRRQLAGEWPVLQLPVDRPRPSEPSFRGSMETFGLSAELTGKLKRRSRQEGVTPYMMLLAAFKALLFRYTGQQDVLVAGVVDTRRRPELEPLVGYFLNTVLLRTQASADLSFCDYLKRTRDTVLGALDNSDVSFNRVLQEFQPKRNRGSQPAVQVMFSIEPPASLFADGWDLTQMDVTVGTSKFDLYLELDERPEGIIGRFLYSTDLFDAATIRRMIGHWTTLLEAAAADPACTLGALPLLTPQESQQLLVEWNDNRQDVPSTTVIGWFEAQAQRTPDAAAVEFEGRSWTYRELDAAASRVAALLRDAGVQRETLVGICLERSLDMVAALLGIWKAGGAYLPLDPGLPRTRLAFMIDDAEPALVLTQRSLAEKLPASGRRVLLAENDAGDRPTVEQTAGPSTLTPEDLAYVIYTSGSTGQPKGVDVPHLGVVNQLAALQREPGFGPRDTMLAVAPLSFDPSVVDLFMPLVAGGRVVLASREAAKDANRLARLIQESRCTMMQATPTTWRALIDAGWAGAPGLKILSGGEALPRELADKLAMRGASLWNTYGPTETTIWTTVQKVEAGSGPVPVGRPIANTRTYVLDARGTPVPIGIPGELHIGGIGVTRGYRNREALTRERFVTSDLAPGGRLYRTGDVVRYQPDGALEFLGRTDNQVKVRGHRIEPEEIEAALESYQGIAAAAVKAWPDAAGDRSLVAHLVTRNGAAPLSRELRQFLRDRLPDYMVPARYIVLPALPKTATGKVDRNALPAPDGPPPPAEFVAPSGEREEKLAAIWRAVLRTPRVGAHDDFFDLGGHSLLAAQLLRRIEKEFGQRLPMSTVFHASTVAQMAALLADASLRARLPRTIEMQATGSQPRLFWVYVGAAGWTLAQAVGQHQPMFGVVLDRSARAALGSAPTLAECAAHLKAEIRAAQPHGPYYLGGYCAGGNLAFEIASQLMAQGEEVRLLFMVHSGNSAYFRRIRRLAMLTNKLEHHMVQLFHRRGRARWDYAVDLGDRISWHFDRVRRRLKSEPKSNFKEVVEQAVLDHEPAPYAGNVVLLQPIERPALLDCRPGWAEVVRGELTAIDIPGTHHTMLKPPNILELGAKIVQCLGRAQAASRDAAAG